jgi:hypothetical protein
MADIIPLEEETPVHQLTKEQATAKLNDLTKQFNATSGRDKDVFSAGAEHATGELKRLEKEAAKILADPIAAGLGGALPSGVMVPFNDGEIAAQKLQGMINDLREDVGLNDAVIREALLPAEHSISPETMEAVLRLEAQLHGSAEWRARLLTGDAKAREQLALIEICKLQTVKRPAA